MKTISVMPSVSEKAIFREMDAEEIEEYVKEHKDLALSIFLYLASIYKQLTNKSLFTFKSSIR